VEINFASGGNTDTKQTVTAGVTVRP